jgi:uncharacterized protein YwqG
VDEPSNPPALPPSLARVRRAIEATAEACLVLRAAGEPVGPAGTVLGGVPRMGQEWPRSPERPMAFVGALDFAELARAAPGVLPWLPEAGRLLFFYDEDEQRWGFDPEDREWSRLVFVEGGEEAPATPPAAIAPHPSRRVRPVRAASFAAPMDARVPALEPAEWEAYSALHAAHQQEIHGHEWLRHQVGGNPDWIQDDARHEAALVAHGIRADGPEAYATDEAQRLEGEAAEWRLLWQVSSDEELGFTWGDVGHLYVLVRADDLARRDFARAQVVLQCT